MIKDADNAKHEFNSAMDINKLDFLVDEKDDKKLIGAINIEKKSDGIWIQALEVSKSYQRHGYGKILVDIAKNQHATKLTVRKTNENANIKDIMC